ncbi:hypothetical protein RPIT_02375 [Tessaracoccus flavus]|uniref:ABC3 transporter permease C-terminal domain-containing protein n=1 Tax=Tessaracoccus flavus TaxID=1610493 RepID=A0A1Q2CCN4_9ACTN|nr:FtsX-like permease family protein [Tessaracoccus flavus]AQP43805.1 hypothetical protein RPIT_02375 [Tessaracoccus flavus]
MTTWWGWGVRRARSSLVLLLTLVALVAVTSGILAFVLGNSGAQATAAARAALTSAAPGEVGIQAQTRLGSDPLAQDELARDRLVAGFAPAPISIWSTIVSEPRPVAVSGQPLRQRLVLWSGAHLLPGALDVDGRWPANPGEAALHRDAADALGIALGEALTIDGRRLTISALWRPADVSDPRWLGNELALRGVDGAHFGPLVVEKSAIEGQQPFIRWAVVPEADRISGEHLSVLAQGAERAKALVADADVTGRGITTEGDLAPTAARAARELAVAEAFGILPVSLLLLVAVVGLAQVAGLLDATREKELQLLIARGSSTRQLVGAAVAETVLFATVGTALGVAAAAVAVRLVAGTWTHTAAVLSGGLLSLALALACLITVAVNGTLRAARGGRPRSDRVRAVAGAATLVVVGGVAALATWQLRREVTFVRTLDGAVTADLIPALAPASLLTAAAVVGLVVLAPVSRVLELGARQLHGAGVWLAGAQLARGLVVQAVPVVLTILATGTATFAALYSGTGAALARDSAMVGQGAELRASLSSAPPRSLEFPTLEGVPGVAASAPVWVDPNASIGNLTLTSLAAPMSVLGSVAEVPGGRPLPAAELAPGLPESHAPLPIPPARARFSSRWARRSSSTRGRRKR